LASEYSMLMRSIASVYSPSRSSDHDVLVDLNALV